MNQTQDDVPLIGQSMLLNDVELITYIRFRLEQDAAVWSDAYRDRQIWFIQLLGRLITVGIRKKLDPEYVTQKMIAALQRKRPGVVKQTHQQLIADVVITVINRGTSIE